MSLRCLHGFSSRGVDGYDASLYEAFHSTAATDADVVQGGVAQISAKAAGGLNGA